MRIVFSCGNAPGLPTGYGGQGLLALRSFQDAKASCVSVLAWNLAIPAFEPFVEYSTEEVLRRQPSMSRIFDSKLAQTIDWTRIRWYSNPYDRFPAQMKKSDMNRIIHQTNADLFVSLQDIFMFEPGAFHCLSAVWLPLHFVPVEHPTVMALADFDIQLPISGWGKLLCGPLQISKENCAVRHVEVVPHGRDITVFKPGERSAEIRDKWGWPQDAFVVLMIASNSEESGRKAFDAQLQAFQRFQKKTDKKVWLHIHSEVARAYDLGRLLETFGLYSNRGTWIDRSDPRMRTHREAAVLGDCCSVTSASELMSVSESELVSMYRAADVLLAATCSEGCGVPILEAQLCGTPVVTTKATAMWEETHFGISAQPTQYIARMDFNSGWMLPNSDGIADALLRISEWSKEEKQAKLDAALPLLQKEFSNESVVTTWNAVLENVKQSLETNFATDSLHLHATRKTMLRAAKFARLNGHLLHQIQESVRLESSAAHESAMLRAAAQGLQSM